MNRAQRRKMGKKLDEPMYNLKQSDIKNSVDTIVRDKTKEIQLEAVEQTLGIVCLCLNAEYGFGEKRLLRMISRVQKQYDCLRQGYITFNDVKMQMKDLGVTLKTY